MTTRPGYVWDNANNEWVEIGQAAVVAPVAYQASQPSSPSTGDIWIDSDDEVPSVDSTLYYRWTKTMSGGETSLSGIDNNSLSLQYTPGYESVFINGVLQARNLDYTATSGSTIGGLTALASNDVVMVESIVAYSVGDTYTQAQIGSLLDAKSPVSTTGSVLLNTTAFTAQSSVSIDNVFSATYTNYKIIVKAVVPSGGIQLRMRLRVGGADNTASNYVFSTGVTNSASAFANNNSSTGTTSFYTTDVYDKDTNLVMDIYNPFDSTNTGYQTSGQSQTIGNATAVQFGGGAMTVTTSYTGFTIFPSSSTITGTIKVYGYK